MFEKPSQQESRYTFKPGVYLATLKRLAEAPDAGFGPGIYWYWNLFNTGKKTVDGKEYDDPSIIIPFPMNPDGSMFEYRTRTTTKFGKGSGDKVAKARAYSEALLSRDIDDDEEPDDIEKQILGKKAVLHIVLEAGTDGKEYMNIRYAEPYKKGMLAPIIPEPEDAFAEDDESDEPVAVGASTDEMPW